MKSWHHKGSILALLGLSNFYFLLKSTSSYLCSKITILKIWKIPWKTSRIIINFSYRLTFNWYWSIEVELCRCFTGKLLNTSSIDYFCLFYFIYFHFLNLYQTIIFLNYFQRNVCYEISDANEIEGGLELQKKGFKLHISMILKVGSRNVKHLKKNESLVTVITVITGKSCIE